MHSGYVYKSKMNLGWCNLCTAIPSPQKDAFVKVNLPGLGDLLMK